MHIFVAGASGVLGYRLLPLLVGRGHQVAGMTRTAAKTPHLAALGAVPVLCDVYDRAGLVAAVVAFAPDLVLHQLTDLPDEPHEVASAAGANARMRTEGTRNLLAAAEAAGARTIAQSTAWQLTDERGRNAVRETERLVLATDGTVLRYGRFYGPGTYFPTALPPRPRIHVQTAAEDTASALNTAAGVLVLTDEGSTLEQSRQSLRPSRLPRQRCGYESRGRHDATA